MSKVIAYDLETSRVAKGTPEVLYLTAYGDADSNENGKKNIFKLSIPVTGKAQEKEKTFCQILEQHLLIPENKDAMFVAWNGNKFDAYFVAKALLESDKWIIKPYMTASKQLRGIQVREKIDLNKKSHKKALSFQFLDGMSMTGIICSLGDKIVDGKVKKGFLSTFAPEYQKLQSPDFEHGEEFNYNNKSHVEYAERDSEGLYHAMKRVEEIIYNLTGLELKPTIGNIAINNFMNNLPNNVEMKRPIDRVIEHLQGPLKRGGYCWASKQYHGPIWKYDLNQAYAAAMRDSDLPAGECAFTKEYIKGKVGVYECTISRHKKSLVPVYVKGEKGGQFTTGSNVNTWLTSTEIEHLLSDNWTVEIKHGYCWSDKFRMTDFVDELEKLRSTDKDGPSGPLGTMVKALGNNAYGKTLEQLWNLEFVLAKELPDGYYLYDTFDENAKHVFAKNRRAFHKKYHCPQIGVFITAHVRTVVRNVALKEEQCFLYADTDCVCFSKDIKHHLEIHPTRYGAWKQEAAGNSYIIIGKKTYYGDDGTRKAKGIITKGLTHETYTDWLNGKLPIQVQTQRINILKFLGGQAMFREQERHGTDVSKLSNIRCINGHFIPI